jgi:DNA-binding response OmpR family regulator
MMDLVSMSPSELYGTRMVEWEGRDYILIVEDDDDVSDTFADALQEDGHRVVSFQDARLALDYLKQKSILPRLIFLDFLMPHMDGWQFLAERRKDARIAEVPVVGVSASDRVDERSLSRNVVQLLRKPVSLDALLGAVRRCASGSFGL